MQDDFLEHLVGLLRHLLERAREDEELRTHLRAAAVTILELVSAAEEDARGAAPQETAPEPPPEWLESAKLEQLREQLSEGSMRLDAAPAAAAAAPAEGQKRPAPQDDELSHIAARCRLKSEAARWALDRCVLMERGADFEVEIQPKDRDIIARAKNLPDCYLWMNHPSGPAPSVGAAEDWEVLAECFENLGRIVSLMQELLPHREKEGVEEFEHVLELAAEAQSALRVSARAVGFENDPDQEKFFLWLRRVAYEDQIYLKRYMKVTDKADPLLHRDLQARIEALDTGFHEARQQGKQRKQLFSRAQYHVRRIERSPGEDHWDDWNKVIVSFEELLGLGLPPSSVEFRKILLPILDGLPDLDDDHPGFDLILREIDTYISSNPVRSGGSIETAPSQEVLQVAELLRGRAVMMIGGEPRLEAKRALEKAFELSELVWVTSNKHQSTEAFRPVVARPDVAVVLLAIRWSSHSFGDVKVFCDEYDKVLVRLPAGYNPNQIAVQILEQASEQLKEIQRA